MTGDVLGGGVVVAITAGLWAVYFLPQWIRRRQFSATEQNALRIQRTLRLLAETTEVPDEVRLEANARDAAAQERILKASRARDEAERRTREAQHRKQVAQAEAEAAQAEKEARNAAAQATKAAQEKSARVKRAAQVEAKNVSTGQAQQRGVSDAERRARQVRARRVRACVSLVMFAGVVAAAIGGVLLATGASPVLLIAGLGVSLVGLLALRALAPKKVSTVAPRAAVFRDFAAEEAATQPAPEQTEQEDAQDRSWTPRPLPKPLYLSHQSAADQALAAAEAEARVRRAAELNAEVRRLAQREAQAPAAAVRAGSTGAAASATTNDIFDVESTTPRVERPRVSERTARAAARAGSQIDATSLRSMGIVDEAEPGLGNLDDVLRRRRSVG